MIGFFLFQQQGRSSSIVEMDANGGNVHPLFPDWKKQPYRAVPLAWFPAEP